MAAFYSPQSNFTDVFQSTPLCYMWNIWAQNAAIKDMQFSSEIDRKEGGDFKSWSTLRRRERLMCVIWQMERKLEWSWSSDVHTYED